MPRVQIDIDDKATASVLLNGHDVNSAVRGFHLSHYGREVPVLTLEVVALDFLSDLGDVEVHVVKTGDQQEAERISRVLLNLSPEEVEREALARLEWGTSATMTGATLAVIQEKVLGNQPSGS